MNLKPFSCTIQVFDPDSGATITEHILPVDSPNAEHAVAATLSNAVAFTPKTKAEAVLAVAFRCVAVEPRA